MEHPEVGPESLWIKAILAGTAVQVLVKLSAGIGAHPSISKPDLPKAGYAELVVGRFEAFAQQH